MATAGSLTESDFSSTFSAMEKVVQWIDIAAANELCAMDVGPEVLPRLNLRDQTYKHVLEYRSEMQTALSPLSCVGRSVLIEYVILQSSKCFFDVRFGLNWILFTGSSRARRRISAYSTRQ